MASLSLLTLNCGLLRIEAFGRKLIEPAPFIAARFAALTPALGAIDADIVALQEIYRGEHKQAVRRSLAHLWPHAAYPRRAPLLKLDSGLLVLSKYPIGDVDFAPYRHAPWIEHLFVDRGLFATRHDSPMHGAIRLISFHTTAGGLFYDPEDAKTDAIRDRQIDAILAEAAREPETPTFLIGDLNAGPPVSMGNYRRVLDGGFVDLLAAHLGEAAADRVATWDSQQPLNRRGPHAHQRPQRIDHVFLHRRHLARWRVTEARLVLTEPVVALDDGTSVTVADHYGLLVRLEIPPA